MSTIQLFGQNIKLEKTDIARKLPLNYMTDYDFYDGDLFNQKCLLLYFKGKYLSIPKIKKQMEAIPKALMNNMRCILWIKNINYSQIVKLIENDIPFFSSQKIAYIPFLGIHIEKKLIRTKIEMPKKFTIATQCVFLWILYQSGQECLVDTIEENLKFSQATIARALLLLFQYGLLTAEGKATRKKYFRIDKRKYWEKGKKYLKSPVKKVVILEDEMQLNEFETFTSGEEALSNMSMLQKPEYGCRAIYKKYYDEKKMKGIEVADFTYSEKYTKLEIWNYNPKLFANKYIDNVAISDDVDIFSLYASLGDLLDDVRVEGEIENLIEEFFGGQRN